MHSSLPLKTTPKTTQRPLATNSIPIPIKMNVLNQQIISPAHPTMSATDLLRAFENDPNDMPPLLYGESYHIGYEPLTEELAFSHPIIGSHQFNAAMGNTNSIGQIRLPRGQLTCDRIVKLIHKFINCTKGISVQLPKFQRVMDINSIMPKRALYYSNIRYALYGGDTAFFTIHMQAYKYKEDQVYKEYVQIDVNFNLGIRSMRKLLTDNLRVYLESNGSVFNRVGGVDRRNILPSEDDIECEYTGDTGFVRPPQFIKKYSAVDEGVNSVFDAPPKPFAHSSLSNRQVLSLKMPEPEPELSPPLSKPKLTRMTNDTAAAAAPKSNHQCNEIDAMFSISNEANMVGPSIDPLHSMK